MLPCLRTASPLLQTLAIFAVCAATGWQPASAASRGFEHYTSCSQCVKAGLGWSAKRCQCGGFANQVCHDDERDCAGPSGGAFAAYIARHADKYPADLLPKRSGAGANRQLSSSLFVDRSVGAADGPHWNPSR